MNKIFYLNSCSTCQRIMKECGTKSFELHDIKLNSITVEALNFMRNKVGSFEALFNKRAIKYKERGLKDKSLTETDYKRLILEEYTFLKRPVYVIDELVFVGNDKNTVNQIKKTLGVENC